MTLLINLFLFLGVLCELIALYGLCYLGYIIFVKIMGRKYYKGRGRKW